MTTCPTGMATSPFTRANAVTLPSPRVNEAEWRVISVSRLIVVVLFFLAVFVGLGLGALGVPSEVAIASGLIVTGAGLVVAGMQPSLKQLKERLPVNTSVVGVAFAAVGAVLFAAGLAA
jgi:hypothetical protein